MDTLSKLITSRVILIYVLTFTSLPVFSQSIAGQEFADVESWLNNEGQKYYKPGSGEKWVRNSSPNGDRFIKVESPVDYTARNGKSYPLVIEKTGQIDGGKIGKAMVTMAKFIGPLALGIQVVGLICELSDICQKSGTDEWENTSSDQTILPSGTVYNDCAVIPYGQSFIDYSTSYNDIQRVGSNSHCSGFPDLYSLGYSHGNYCYTPSKPHGCEFERIWVKTVDNQPLPSPDSKPVTDLDWAAAETKLNDPRFDEPLLANGQPVPLANLPILGNVPPITLEESETINRDSNGNVTGTSKTTTVLTVSDGATETRPGRVIGTETTTKTDFDNAGQQTNTQTTQTGSPPPDKPAEPPTISFDNVPNSDIEEEEIDADLQPPESWGEGACPADKTISVGFGDLTFDMQPTCDFAIGVRPVLIFIASITAMFIISGIRVE